MFDLVYQNKVSVRSEYLSWSHDLVDLKIFKTPLKQHLESRSNFSYWWLSLFVEKCNFSKSPEIDNAIDASLAIENVSQGSIQLKATLVDNPQDDSDFSLLGDAVDIIYDSLHTVSSIQKISIDKNTLETFDPGGLPDGSIIRINAVISDIAGNQRVGTIVAGQLRTITVDYTPPDISNIESNISVAISAENNQNIV